MPKSGSRAKFSWKAEYGGMPAWGIAAALALIVVLFAVPAVVNATAEPATPYVRPSDAFADPAPTESADAATVLFIGDSYSAGAAEGAVRWTTIVSQSQEWTEENVALGGTGYATSSGVNGCGLDYCATYPEVIAELEGIEPSQIIVSGGRNDSSDDLDAFRAGVDATFAGLTERFPGVPVAVTLPLGDDDTPTELLAPKAEIVAEVAAAYGVRVIDLGQPLGGRADLVGADSIHPNAEGHQAIADAFLAAW